jgi:rRNA maturation RNase YbeY
VEVGYRLKVLVNNLSSGELEEKGIYLICRKVLEGEGASPRSTVSVTAVDEEHMAELNLTYTGREGCTDVLSFPMGEEDGEDLLLGDVVICPSEVARRAPEYRVPPGSELLYVVAHGILHLLGYDDDTEEGWRNMDDKARQYLGVRVEEEQG